MHKFIVRGELGSGDEDPIALPSPRHFSIARRCGLVAKGSDQGRARTDSEKDCMLAALLLSFTVMFFRSCA